jgi:hypothetical protein
VSSWMQDASLTEGRFRTDYHHALSNIARNSNEILQKLQMALQSDGDLMVITSDILLPSILKIPIVK